MHKFLFLDHINKTGMIGRMLDRAIEDPNFEPKHVILLQDDGRPDQWKAFWINMNKSRVWEANLLAGGAIVGLWRWEQLIKYTSQPDLRWRRSTKIRGTHADQIMARLEKLL